MYDRTIIPSKHHSVTASSDDLGKYGSIFAPDSDSEIPQPPDLYSETKLPEIPDNSNAARLK